MKSVYTIELEFNDQFLNEFERILGIEHTEDQNGNFPIELIIADEIGDILNEYSPTIEKSEIKISHESEMD